MNIKKISITWANIGLLLAGLVGAGMFGYSLVQQTALQSKMNDTMGLINDSIVTTGAVVQKTSQTLEPLVATTASLVKIEQQEQQTVGDLNAMNAHLSNTATSERGIITGLDALNKITGGVSTDLTSTSRVNDSLLDLSKGSVGQAERMAENVGTINSLTATSIDQLHELNQKLAPLRAVQLP